MPEVFLGLGSNLGDRVANIQSAVRELGPDVDVKLQSRLYETPPWGVEDQPGFINMVLRAETALSPSALRIYVKRIEATVGRTVTYHWGPRVIDIDILLYGDQIIDVPNLVIPHPQMHKRPFVLVPLAEIAPDVKHPALGYTVTELLQHVNTAGINALPE